MSLSTLKKHWLLRVIIFSFGVLLIVVAFPLFCRFTATALDSGNISNVFAGLTGVFISILGLPLMVLALHCRRLRAMLWDLQDSPIGCWFTTLVLIIVPGQIGWYLYREIYSLRCGDGPLILCAPVLMVTLLGAAFSIALIGGLIFVLVIEPGLPRLRRWWSFRFLK